MKLYYRGASYEYNPTKVANRNIEQPFQPVSQFRAAYNLIYRGFTYRVDPNAKSATIPLGATYKLSYRGINYLVNRNALGEVTLITQLSNPLQVATEPELTTLS
jgi:YHS domain-containing protein